MDICLLAEHDAAAFVRLRLEALTRELRAFRRAPAEALPWPLESASARLRAAPEGDFLVGAFDGGRWSARPGSAATEGQKCAIRG
jgi:hypothetical protein